MDKILIVDDEVTILHLVASYLKAEGYDVYTAQDGMHALRAVKTYKPDLIILDIMLPGMDGLDVLGHIRHDSDAYVILLTARTEEIDKIVGLSVGADDYVTKPFSPRELTARVKAALRRLRKDDEVDSRGEVLSYKQIKIDPNSHQVLVNGKSIELTPLEFNLLAALAQNHGRVLTREILLEKVWGYEFLGNTRVVDVHMGHLRQKLGIPAIKTVRGLGYRLDD